MHTIYIVATLDTKGEEVLFLKELIKKNGCQVKIIDCSFRRHSIYKGDISREDLLLSVNEDEKTFTTNDKDYMIETMKKATADIVANLYNDDQLDGIISIGGAQGTMIATGAMRSLPIGVPKYMVSAVANGNATFGPFVGVSDITIMHSVVDIAGLNHILVRILKVAASAICGMVKVATDKHDVKQNKNVVGITMAGVTTPCVIRIKDCLQEKGFEVIIFHCNGIGAQAMEKLVETDEISFVIDISPHDIMDTLNNGLMPAYENRLKPIIEAGIPLIFVPGSADFILYNGIDNIPEDKKNRMLVKHNAFHTHVKANYDEMFELGKYICKRLKYAKGFVKIIIPKRGYSQLNFKGGPLYEPESDQGFMDAIEQFTGDNIQIEEVDMHINDTEFANYCSKELYAILDRMDFEEIVEK